jgi:hypothetical protein
MTRSVSSMRPFALITSSVEPFSVMYKAFGFQMSLILVDGPGNHFWPDEPRRSHADKRSGVTTMKPSGDPSRGHTRGVHV